jgi:hypothetical protein
MVAMRGETATAWQTAFSTQSESTVYPDLRYRQGDVCRQHAMVWSDVTLLRAVLTQSQHSTLHTPHSTLHTPSMHLTCIIHANLTSKIRGSTAPIW